MRKFGEQSMKKLLTTTAILIIIGYFTAQAQAAEKLRMAQKAITNLSTT